MKERINPVYDVILLLRREQRVDGQRQHRRAQVLRHRKLPGPVAQVGVGWLGVHRQRIVNHGWHAALAQKQLELVAAAGFGYLNGVLVKHVAAARIPGRNGEAVSAGIEPGTGGQTGRALPQDCGRALGMV